MQCFSYFLRNTHLNPAVVFTFLCILVLVLGLVKLWRKCTGAKLWSFLAGAIVFAVFALGLENLLHQVCLLGDSPLSRAILGSPLLYTLYGSLSAGVFEETGRLCGFRLLLREEREWPCSVACGIGHGGCEAIALVAVPYLMMILVQLHVLGWSSSIAEIMHTAVRLRWSTALIAVLERCSAMMIHIGLSMLVFTAAWQKGKLWHYPAAIALHALADVPAALYQFGTLPYLAAVEICAFVWGALCLVLGILALRRYDRRERVNQGPELEIY